MTTQTTSQEIRDRITEINAEIFTSDDDALWDELEELQDRLWAVEAEERAAQAAAFVPEAGVIESIAAATASERAHNDLLASMQGVDPAALHNKLDDHRATCQSDNCPTCR